MSLTKAVLVFAAAAFASTAAFAGNNGSTSKTAVTPSFALKLKNEAFVQGNGDTTALTQYQYTPIDSGTTLNCTRVCTISATVSSQVQTGGADWAIGIEVDGSFIESQYQGVQSGPSSFVVGNVEASAPSLAIGHHIFNTLLNTESTTATYQYY